MDDPRILKEIRDYDDEHDVFDHHDQQLQRRITEYNEALDAIPLVIDTKTKWIELWQRDQKGQCQREMLDEITHQCKYQKKLNDLSVKRLELIQNMITKNQSQVTQLMQKMVEEKGSEDLDSKEDLALTEKLQENEKEFQSRLDSINHGTQKIKKCRAKYLRFDTDKPRFYKLAEGHWGFFIEILDHFMHADITARIYSEFNGVEWLINVPRRGDKNGNLYYYYERKREFVHEKTTSNVSNLNGNYVLYYVAVCCFVISCVYTYTQILTNTT